ncbi:wall-associated receptor kinase-like 6 [Silene latifolia]|uniref:wall-associated receptor kinase-like 6 n=1 Tax=Silene latifolia TaxID=37657 RepID=UPI003D76C70E
MKKREDINNRRWELKKTKLRLMHDGVRRGIVIDAAAFPSLAKPGCRDKCGNVTIPYPFGMGPSCYYNEWYSITCDNLTPTISKFGLQVLQIALSPTEVLVDPPFSFNCTSGNSTWTSTDFSGSPYTFSTDNAFAPVHCPATILSNGGDKVVAQCGSVCDLNDGYTLQHYTPLVAFI